MRHISVLLFVLCLSPAATAQLAPLPSCGNGVCDNSSASNVESYLTCPLDCPNRCGDGCCELCELFDSAACPACPIDCDGSSDPDDVCGDGCPAIGEDCDFGPQGSDSKPNYCRTDCLLPSCGDGIVDDAFGDECDSDLPEDFGNGPDQCRADCVLPFCGDGIFDPGNGEECDDGNNNPDDTCNNACLFPGCGNFVIDDGEYCDTGGTDPECLETCQSFFDCCVPNTCGDGVPFGYGEICDDGNTVDGDTCRYDCGQDFTDCGDGVLDPGEACDESTANADTPDALCRTDCSQPRCGDGVVDTGEHCDGTADCAPDCFFF